MMTDIQLTKLGLSENEAKVYLALLSLGLTTAGKIAKLAQVKRPTTYLALENLIRLGLVVESATPKEKLFKPESPEKLYKLTKKMRRQVIDAEMELEQLMPNLKALQKNLISPPEVNFYQGMEGIKNIFGDFTSSPETWYFFGATEQIVKNLSAEEINEILDETDKLRQQAGRPKAYMITDKEILSIKHFQSKQPTVREIKIFPEPIKTKSALIIYENKLALISFEGVPFGAIIESTAIVELLKILYLKIWKNIK